MTVIVTGFSPKGYLEYGSNFLGTFDKHWPKSASLLCFTEIEVPIPRKGSRSLWSCDGAAEFVQRHEKNLAAHGRVPNKYWRPKHIYNGYHFAFDAVKFCKQCFIPEKAASELPDGTVMAWIDADVVTFSAIPEGFVEQLLGDADLCYLGRPGTHSEIGFWAVRLNDRTRDFLAHLADIYRTDEIFSIQEWHSAFAFDHVRVKHEKAGQLRTKNLSPPNGRAHVWFQTVLGKYMDHLKGDRRKKLGRSPERVI
jgi:hypothetical protein